MSFASLMMMPNTNDLSPLIVTWTENSVPSMSGMGFSARRFPTTSGM